MQTYTNDAESNLVTSSSEINQVEAAKKRKKHHKSKKFKPNFKIPGVHKIILSRETQETIGCVVGETVTSEKPWITVDKELINENLELHAVSSEFLPLKDELEFFGGNLVLIGYIPDESKDYDEFYVCITEDAIRAVNKIVAKLQRIQEESLKNAVHKKIKEWKSLGSEKEIEETTMKTNRKLIEVEIESRYPLKMNHVFFRHTKAEDTRDSYMELISSEDSSTLYKKRIDAFVQVAPNVVQKEAQTVCTFPKNSYTQYLYEFFIDEEEEERFENSFKNYFLRDGEVFFDILRVNDNINLYTNDYESLVLNTNYTMQVAIPETKDYLCFINMQLCQGKMISSIAWHPMWSGCIIVAYVDIAPGLYLENPITSDNVYKAVHDPSPVLFWSFNDDLKPKLILETPRPVYAVSCCPYDENLVIGGCVNGQIILWDITNKLSRVEEEEVLSVNQQGYRLSMWSLMTWMKNVFDLAVLRPAALSDLKYSHKGCINSISWMSPFHTVSKTGKIEEGHSLQFLSSGEEGCIMIWDLLKKPTFVPGGFKAIRKMRRLKKRPSALLVDESPFKKLHLNLKPIYKINVSHVLENHRLLNIASFFALFFKPQFEISSKSTRKSLNLEERLFYKPIMDKEVCSTRKHFMIGTMEGDFIQAEWDGLNFDSGEVVNWEDCQFVSYGKYHDGPVVSVHYSSQTKTIMSLGGRILAIWRDDFLNHPVMWRKSESIYTAGSWFEFDQSSLKVIRIDGYIEIWTLYWKSKTPIQTFLTSNGACTEVGTHPRKIRRTISALCDYRGSLRLFSRKTINPILLKAKADLMREFVSAEVERKKAFLQWQEDWNKKNVVEVETVEVVEEAPIEEIETKKPVEKKKITKISPGQRYLETVQEQHRANEQSRIKRIILQKKQMNTDELLKRREPLRKLEEENEIKKRKQRNKLKDSDQIFSKTVAMLFPDIHIEKQEPPTNPYDDSYTENAKLVALEQYQNIAIEAQDYVDDNPFHHDFSWSGILKQGRQRRTRLDDSSDYLTHTLRYKEMKERKAKIVDVSASLPRFHSSVRFTIDS